MFPSLPFLSVSKHSSITDGRASSKKGNSYALAPDGKQALAMGFVYLGMSDDVHWWWVTVINFPLRKCLKTMADDKNALTAPPTRKGPESPSRSHPGLCGMLYHGSWRYLTLIQGWFHSCCLSLLSVVGVYVVSTSPQPASWENGNVTPDG